MLLQENNNKKPRLDKYLSVINLDIYSCINFHLEALDFLPKLMI